MTQAALAVDALARCCPVTLGDFFFRFAMLRVGVLGVLGMGRKWKKSSRARAWARDKVKNTETIIGGFGRDPPHPWVVVYCIFLLQVV